MRYSTQIMTGFRRLWMTHAVYATRAGVVVSLVMAVTLSACGYVPQPQRQVVVGAPPIVWQPAPPGQGFASGAAGAIALKWLDFTPQQFRIYFVFKPSGQAPPPEPPVTLQITASASLPVSPTTPAVPLAATLQTLGQIGAYTIGVLHIGRFDHAGQLVNRAGQIISMTITAPALVGAAPWRLAPLHQLIVEPHAQTAWGALGAYQDGLPEAQWSGPVQAQLVSYVKVVMPGQAVGARRYVFVRSDGPVTVQVISQAQYLALAGGENFTP
jgi:hypothetical protein